MVRHWATMGKWSMPTTGDQQLIEVFKQETGIEPSAETRQIIIGMVSKYGSIKLSQYMTKVFNDKIELDISRTSYSTGNRSSGKTVKRKTSLF